MREVKTRAQFSKCLCECKCEYQYLSSSEDEDEDGGWGGIRVRLVVMGRFRLAGDLDQLGPFLFLFLFWFHFEEAEAEARASPIFPSLFFALFIGASVLVLVQILAPQRYNVTKKIKSTSASKHP